MNRVDHIRSLDDYFHELTRLLERETWVNAESAAQLLSIRDKHSELRFLQVDQLGTARNRPYIAMEAFDYIACFHTQVLYYLEKGMYEEAYQSQTQIIQTINTELMPKIKESNWYMPILYAAARDLLYVAKLADDQTGDQDDDDQAEKTTFYEDSAKYLMESYRTSVTDARKEPQATKKISMLNLTNQLFRIYFKINKLNLLRPLIRAIDNAGILYDYFSMADKVTYNYYLGQKAMFDNDLPLAEKALTYAFNNCPSDRLHNKRLILTFLIPVKMFLGQMPSIEILQKYNLNSFVELVESVKEGNLARLDAALQHNEEFFISCGLFLILEKLRSIAFRTLFKKVAHLIGDTRGIDDVDEDELECIVATLIAEKKIKGYVSNVHQILVLSKQTPFPPLSLMK
ncbi:unnamed protein product, partial [Mesorhabditis spiculigera]